MRGTERDSEKMDETRGEEQVTRTHTTDLNKDTQKAKTQGEITK